MTINPYPQPFPIHLNLGLASMAGAMAMAKLLTSSAELPLSKEQAQKLEQKINQAAKNKYLNFLQGVNTYAHETIPAWQPQASLIWQEGNTRILDYGGGGQKILFISPLINRANILDLNGDKSLMHFLKSAGYNPLLVDWGDLGISEKDFDSDSYISRLEKFTASEDKLVIGGYCMGGLLALKLARRIKPKALILLATPWNFHAPDVKRIEIPSALMQKMLSGFDAVPPEIIQSLFLTADPWRVYNKYSSMPRGSAAMLEVEYWVNSGVAMSVPMARESIIGWAINNTPGRGRWLDVSAIQTPTYLGCPTTDKIVPIGASIPLAGLLPNVTLQKFPCGHIGMLTKKLCFQPLADWLNIIA